MIKTLLEEVNKQKIFSSKNWKAIEQKQPKLAKDFNLYLGKEQYEKFIELANQVIDANNANKTNAIFPKLDTETWQNIIKIIAYIKNEDPKFKKLATASPSKEDPWAYVEHDRVSRLKEELELLEAKILELLI